MVLVCKGTFHIYHLFFFSCVFVCASVIHFTHTHTHTLTQAPHKAAIILTSGGGDSCADLTQKMHYLRNTEEEAR